MSTAGVLRMARADMLERMRRPGFLLVLGAATWLGWLAYNGNIVMKLGHARGVFDAAWAGTVMALSGTLFVSLAGFYVVKNAVERDRTTGVGQILAATRMPAPVYLLAKWLSNFAVLASVVGVLGVAAVVLQRSRGAGTALEPWRLLAPLLLLALPAMALVAAAAVVFETVPALAGGGGNVLYFFLWTAALTVPLMARVPAADWSGIGVVEDSLRAAVVAQAPDAAGGLSFSAGPRRQAASLTVVAWPGIEWTAPRLAHRLSLVAGALLAVLAAALWFDRFDPARWRGRRRARVRAPVAPDPPRWGGAATLARLDGIARRGRFTAMVVAEIHLALAGVSRWWLAAAAALTVAAGLVPRTAAGTVQAVAWLLPLVVWSRMGVRERRDGTAGILFSCPHPLRRHLAAVWVAGAAVAAASGAGLALRLLAAGDVAAFAGWGVAVLFIPALALALGVWSGGSRLFEALYTAWWYVGPMNAVVALDFTGVAAPARPLAVTGGYLAAAGVLLAAAVAGRARQLRG